MTKVVTPANQALGHRPGLRNAPLRVKGGSRYVRKIQMTKNQELIKNLIPLWYATRLWAEDLLRRYLDLADAVDILKPENRGKKPISGTNWMYRTHGVGVDIYKTEEVGGIDFDFDKPNP